MGLIQDIAGTGVFGSGAQNWARGQKRNGSQSSRNGSQASSGQDEYGAVPSSGDEPDQWWDENSLNTGRRKRSSNKRS